MWLLQIQALECYFRLAPAEFFGFSWHCAKNRKRKVGLQWSIAQSCMRPTVSFKRQSVSDFVELAYVVDVHHVKL